MHKFFFENTLEDLKRLSSQMFCGIVLYHSEAINVTLFSWDYSASFSSMFVSGKTTECSKGNFKEEVTQEEEGYK